MNRMASWDDVQERASAILAEGLYRLTSEPFCQSINLLDLHPCNYLVSYHETPLYVGEASAAKSRIRTQFDERRSTFYRNYLSTNPDTIITISSFNLQLIETRVGRKEIEDFGIVNLPTSLNRFQLGKRSLYRRAVSHAQWDSVQVEYSRLVEEGAARCMDTEFSPWPNAISPNGPGIYLIRDGNGRIVYVGESSDVGARYLTHSGRTYFSAVRRNLGTDILGYTLQTRNGKKRYFDPPEDREISSFLERCLVAFYPVNFGRYEVEEFLIGNLKPILNRKSKNPE